MMLKEQYEPLDLPPLEVEQAANQEARSCWEQADTDMLKKALEDEKIFNTYAPTFRGDDRDVWEAVMKEMIKQILVERSKEKH